MRIALVHDFLTQLGGAERVLEELHEMYPEAPVYTLVHDREKTENRYARYDIRTSFIQKLPGGIKKYKWYLALMPLAVKKFDLSGFDIIISDASAFAKGVVIRPGQVHVCYCHTPTRYLWQDAESYRESLPYPWIVKIALKPLQAWLKKWDYRAAQVPHVIVANSKEVQRRIKKYYDRESQIVYPPVNTDFFSAPGNPDKDNFFFTAGRLEPYKRTELIVKTFNSLGIPLKIAGAGSQLEKLRRIAGPNIELLGRVSDDELRRYYRKAKGFVFAALEDAGMVLVEAMSAGTPVVAYRGGGAEELVGNEGLCGILFESQTQQALADAIQKFLAQTFNIQSLLARSEIFDKKRFKSQFGGIVESSIKNADRN